MSYSRSLIPAVLVAVALVSAACGASKEAPPTAPSGSSARPSATEKGVIKAPKQAFNPNGNAADGIAALESQGYTVVVQNGGGDPGKRNPLSQCRIAGVDGLRGDTPPENTTVYLTVAC